MFNPLSYRKAKRKQALLNYFFLYVFFAVSLDPQVSTTLRGKLGISSGNQKQDNYFLLFPMHRHTK